MPDTPEITLRPDSKGRITLGKLAEGISSFRVHREADGRVILEPYVEIPKRERWLYKNPKALAALEAGIADAAAGRLVSMGSFAKYANDDIDEN
jgi:predicted transcriptional regulator